MTSIRRFGVLVKSALLESLSQPLSTVLFLVATVTIHLVPTFHYHQFGEPGRLARECGFSALLVFGLAFATSAAVQLIVREFTLGTAAVALARPIPRSLFFIGKCVGVLAAFAIFCAAVAAATALSVEGGRHMAQYLAGHADSTVWAPGLALGVGGTLVAFILAGFANRFLHVRFCVTACVLVALAQPLALVAACALVGTEFLAGAWQLTLALAVLAAGCAVFIVCAAALAVRIKPAAVTALMFALVLLAFLKPLTFLVPRLTAFWLSDALANGGSLAAAQVVAPLTVAGLLVVAWLAVGALMLEGKEVS